jgi:hypothetical protein
VALPVRRRSSSAPVAAVGVGAVIVLAALAPARARAQTRIAEASSSAAPAPAPPAPVKRPRFSLAIGMGLTLDRAGFVPARTEAVPSFLAVGGAGDGLLGAEVGAYASSASGRFGTNDTPIDRVALDAAAVVRPGAWWRPGDKRRFARTVRSFATELGLGVERQGHTGGSGARIGVHTGAHIEVPLTPASYGTSDSAVVVRLGVRRLFGLYRPEVGGVAVGDTTDLYAAIGMSF